MRVVHMISHYPYASQFTDDLLAERYVCSGGEIAAYQVTKHLAKLGHEVLVATSSADREDSVETHAGIQVFRYASWCRVGDTCVSPALFWRPLKDMGEVDIVHVQHTTPPGGIAGMICARKWRKPLVVTHHGFERFDGYGSLARRLLVFLSAELFVDLLLSQATTIISISPNFVRDSRFLWKYAEKTAVIPNGVDLEEFRIEHGREESRLQLGLPQDRPLVLYLGSLIPRKGVDVLLGAMRYVVAQLPEAELVMVGRGPMGRSLRALAGQMGLSSRVRFVGFVAESSRRALYYKAADVMVVPSVNSMEMFPLVLLEGSAAGCVIVASDLETFKGILTDGVNAVVTRAGNENSLARGILAVLQDRALQQALSGAAFRRVGEYSWPRVAKQTEDLYLSLLQRGTLRAASESGR